MFITSLLYYIGKISYQLQLLASPMKSKTNKGLAYQGKVSKCEEFLKTFEDYDIADYGPAYQHYGRRKYLIQIQKVANGESKVVQILMEDLESFFRKEDEKELIKDFHMNTLRSTKIFKQILQKIMPQRSVAVSTEDQIRTKFEGLLNAQRKHNLAQQEVRPESSNQKIPNSMLYNFQVYIIFGPSSKIHLDTITDLTADKIGSLVIFKAIVIRVSNVRPQLHVATYACDSCGFENYQEISDHHYKPLTKCMSKICVQNNVNGRLTFLPGHSTFKQYQQIKVQQTHDQLSIGKIPKTFIIHAKGQNSRKAAPGDVILLQGILLPVQNENGRINQSLSFSTYLEVYKITRQKKKYIQMNITEQQVAKIQSIRCNLTDEEIFKKLSKSIAPQIYGLETVKKALLLLMVGGTTKITHDNLKIRGEINVALIGDPGIAKSQLLKYISQVAPRGIYTSGKGSSGVGLTAAITVDPMTRQVFLQAGALVLADMGVCCIDEFDKMSQYDRTAIHQVMEQQTVSIAKAGITTSLNARASILAAANPLFGRYNRNQSAHKNINLPAALLSRFDLIFILLDQADQTRDKQLATHIGRVHQSMKAPQHDQFFDTTFLRHYVALSKKFDPIISEDLHKQIIQTYIEKRQQQTNISKQGQNYTTMRSLLALIRLCQARARLRFSNQVIRADIIDCLDIIEQSQKLAIESRENKGNLSDISGNIFALIRSVCMMNENNMKADLTLIEKRVATKGYSLNDLEKTLSDYQKLNVLMVSNGTVTLLN